MKKATKIFYLLATLLCVALLALTVSCGDKAGGGNVPDDTTTKVNVPELPAATGTDPFAAATYLTEGVVNARYKVDSENKTLTSEYLDSETSVWEPEGIVKYSYQESAEGTLVSFVYDKIYDATSQKWYTMQEYYDQAETLYKENKKADFAEDFDYLNGLSEEERNTTIANSIAAAAEDGMTLTEEDFASVDTYCDKLFASDYFKEELQAYMQNLKDVMEHMMVYLVQVGEPVADGTAQITVEGQYITDLEWNKQTSGNFGKAGSSTNTNTSYGYVYPPYGYFYLYDEEGNSVGNFEIDSVDTTDKTMTGTYTDTSNNERSPLTVDYTQSGQGEDTIITVSINGQSIELTWSPDIRLGF